MEVDMKKGKGKGIEQFQNLYKLPTQLFVKVAPSPPLREVCEGDCP